MSSPALPPARASTPRLSAAALCRGAIYRARRPAATRVTARRPASRARRSDASRPVSKRPAYRALAPLLLLALLTLVACQASQPASPAPPPAPSGSAAVASAPGAASAPSPAPAPAPAPPRRVTLITPGKTLPYLPYYLGRDLGLYQAEGIELDVREMTSHLAIAAVASGEVAYIAPIGASIQAAVGGQDLRAVLFVLKDVTWSLVTAPEITSVADLRGKTIAVSALTGSDALALQAALRAHGVALDEVNPLAAQAPSNRFVALTTGAIPAAVLAIPLDQQAERLGFRSLVWMADHFHRPQSALITTPRQLRDQPDEVRRMIRPTLRSVQALREREADTIAYVTREFGVEPDLAQGTYQQLVRVLSPDGEVAPEAVEEEIAEARARLGVATEVPLAQVMDLTLLREVQREIGLRP
jgi:ABC-type nitrate/sulfonate/bicarbonate transport system substrate-binding protein